MNRSRATAEFEVEMLERFDGVGHGAHDSHQSPAGHRAGKCAGNRGNRGSGV